MAYINLDVEILEVESMFPNVDTDDRDVTKERILISSSDDFQALGGEIVTLRKERQQPDHLKDRKTYEPSPSGTLDPSSSGVELGLEFINGSKVTLDLSFERTIPEDATPSTMLWVRGKVLPEEGVVDMT